MVEQQTTPRSRCNRRRWKKQEDAILEIWSRMASSLFSQTPRSRITVDGVISTDPRWRHSSSALSLARLAFDPNHIISVLSGFSCSRFEVHQSWIWPTHLSRFIRYRCTSVSRICASSWVLSAYMWSLAEKV